MPDDSGGSTDSTGDGLTTTKWGAADWPYADVTGLDAYGRTVADAECPWPWESPHWWTGLSLRWWPGSPVFSFIVS
ncbi:MAG: hypothetical protein U0904_10015 [Candidatus Nanopelagicales bacterium]|nr:hypothetical protein [Candidatus Nanopelagicales bacterium]